MSKPCDVFFQPIDDEAIRVHTFLWDRMRKQTLRQGALDYQHAASAIPLALGELVSGKHPPRRNVQIVANDQRNLSIFIVGTVSTLSAKALYAFRAPVAIREVVDSMPVDLLLCGCCGSHWVLASSRLLSRRLELLFPVEIRWARNRFVLRRQHRIITQGDTAAFASTITTSPRGSSSTRPYGHG
jgi:hypothetical protein